MKDFNLKKTKESKKGCYLWEIKGGNAKMYINGTVHIVPESFFPLKNEITNSFEECNNLVLEVLLDDIGINHIKITDDIINNKDYIYEDGDSLYNHFPKEKIISLRDYLVKNGTCSQMLAKKFYKLKPIVVKCLISNAMYKKMGINLDHIGIDYYFMKQAKEKNKRILELETKEFQDELLKNFHGNDTSKNHNKDINSNSSDVSPENREDEKIPIIDVGLLRRFLKLNLVPRVMANYINYCGHLYTSEKTIKNQRKRLISDGSPLIGNRDEEMCKKLVALLKNNDSYFVAVGAAHLLGEDSIIDRLKKQGYEVIRIC